LSSLKTYLLNKRIFPDALTAYLMEAMSRCDIRPEDARITADVLVTTDTWGVYTHGSKQLRPLLRLGAVPEVVAEGPAWSMIDGHYALATVTSCQAMEKAVEKAKTAGVGFVGVRNSNHFGGAGYYANLATRYDMIGLAMTNTNPLMVVPGGKMAVLGTNPFSYAVPGGREPSVFLDIATSMVAASKPISARGLGQQLPEAWLVDKDGIPTTDPSHYPEEGGMLPMAGHKGYGLALMIEVFSAVLTGADMLSGVKLWLEDHPGPLNQGHTFIAIDVNSMMPIARFKDRMDHVIREIKTSPKAKGSDRIYLPGEKEWENRKRALQEGMILPEHVLDRLIGLAEDTKIDMAKFFP